MPILPIWFCLAIVPIPRVSMIFRFDFLVVISYDVNSCNLVQNSSRIVRKVSGDFGDLIKGLFQTLLFWEIKTIIKKD